MDLGGVHGILVCGDTIEVHVLIWSFFFHYYEDEIKKYDVILEYKLLDELSHSLGVHIFMS